MLFLKCNNSKFKKIITIIIICLYGQLLIGQQICEIGNNNGFEIPVIEAHNISFINESMVPDWSTTASDNLIEIWSSDSAYEGNQFAELNANEPSTLIKSFYATSGKTITLSFAHRGREGTDTMSVEAGPDGGPYTQLGMFSTDNNAWVVYNREFTPASTGLYQLRFTGIASIGTIPSIGNFLDGIEANRSAAEAQIKNINYINCDTTIIIDGSTSSSGSDYSYEWSTNDGVLVSGSNTHTVTVSGPGTYTLTVTNTLFGCVDQKSVTIPLIAPIVLSETHTATICNGVNNGSIDLNITGGTAPYTFLWSNGLTTEDIENLYKGTYSVTVTDANNCTALIEVIIDEPPKLSLSETHIDEAITCSRSGSIDLTVSGGTAPYTFLWSNGQTTKDIDNLSLGNYIVTVSDANGCTATLEGVIGGTPAILLSETHINVSCANGNDASIDLNVSGGSVPYTFLWNNGQTTEDLTTLTVGIYSVTVTDADNCSVFLTVVISEPPALSLSETHVDVICTTNGSIDLTVSGGTAPYTFIWSNGLTTEDIDDLLVGTYSVEVTDNNNCKIKIDIIIGKIQYELLLTESHIEVTCVDSNDGSIDLSVSGGTAPYTFSWSNGLATEDIENLIVGTYLVVVTDVYGCETTLEVTVNSLEKTVPVFNVITSNAFSRSHTITIERVSPTNNLTYQYRLDNGLWQNSPIFENISSGVHIVYIRDTYSCTEFEKTVILIGYPSFFTPNGDGYHDTWNVFDLAWQKVAKIKIFDRYGKLLKVLRSEDVGWDGTYNNKKMPSNDYWFTVEYIEPNNSLPATFKAHFTLKR